MNMWLLGILVFLARVFDVSIGTLRTISIVQGRIKMAFILGFFEVSMWLLVISAVLNEIMNNPWLAVVYAFGFSTGNVVGILMERKLAMGLINFRVISSSNGKIIADSIREQGYQATTFEGDGKEGKVIEVYVVCERKELRELIKIVKNIEPEAFYITEQVGIASKLIRPTMIPATGWRSALKKK
jgi:uncharacterized protein YebE (UPF0316 family)